MSAGFDAVVIGAGVNGLTAAATLGRAGRRVLLLDEAETPGGLCRELAFAPGFLAGARGGDAGWVPPQVARAAGIPAPPRWHPLVPVAVPAGDREWLCLTSDPMGSANALRRYAPGDADRWPEFTARVARLAGFLEALYVLPAPDIDASSAAELLPLLGVARKLRGLGRRSMLDLLRWMPMSVQEVLDDEFTGEALKAALGAGGVTGIRQGPRSGGTAFVLLHHQVGAAAGAFRHRGDWTGGPGAWADALAAAARRHGVTIRSGVRVAQIQIRDDRAVGVVLAGGEEISATSVLSSADPVRTLRDLVDPVWLDPEFLLAVRNIKLRGSASRVLFALDGLPEFAGLTAPLAGCGVLSLTPSLEQLERAADAAKYGAISERPHLDLQFPSLRWPDSAPEGKHVLVAGVQWTPYALREGAWTAERRDALGRAVTAQIEAVAPGFEGLVRERVVKAPPDLEAEFGVTEGALGHGELTLDQILFMRPVPGASRYATPVQQLYLCGAGSHPGGGISGGPGWLAARQVLKGAS